MLLPILLAVCSGCATTRSLDNITDSWQPRDEGSPLHRAAAMGDVATCRALIATGTNVNTRVDGWTPLHVACNNKQSEVCRLLMEHGADLTAKDRNGITPFHRAMRGWWNWRTDMLPVYGGKLSNDCQNEDAFWNCTEEERAKRLRADAAEWLKTVEWLVSKGADVNRADGYGATPLMWVCDQLQCAPCLPGASETARDLSQLLIRNGASVTAMGGWQNQTALHKVLLWRTEHYTPVTEICETLLSAGADVNARGEDGDTPLHYAAQYGGPVLTKLLISKGAQVDARNNDGNTPLVGAARWGQEETCLVLIAAGAKKRWVDKSKYHEGGTLFSYAAGNGCVRLCNLLIDQGADVNEGDGRDGTVLHAAAGGGRTNTCALLIHRGANVNAKTRAGLTSLHKAAGNNNVRLSEYFREACLDICVLLVANGADVNAADSNGATPLHMAAESDQTETCTLLLANGANVNAVRKDGNTPLHSSAADWGSSNICALLIRNGANVNAINVLGRTPLHNTASSAYSGRAEKSQILLNGGADVNAKDKDGKTPLRLALPGGARGDIYDLLLKYGADVDSRDNKGRTGLHEAALGHITGSIDWLIEHGADINAKDNDGNTPLALAKIKGIGCIIELIRKNGGKEQTQ